MNMFLNNQFRLLFLLTLALPVGTGQASELEHLIQSGHSNSVNSVAWSPDGKSIVTCSADKTAIIWIAATGEQLRTLAGHTHDVVSVAWSPDGKSIATGSRDTTAIIWDAASGEKLNRLVGHKQLSVTSLAWSPDGKSIVTVYLTQTIVWNAETGEKVRLARNTETFSKAAWSPDGRFIVTVSSLDNSAFIWNATTGEKIRTLSGHTDNIMSVAWNPDGKSIITGSQDKKAIIWNASTGEQLRTLTTTKWVWGVAWNPVGKLIVIGSSDDSNIWNAATGEKLNTLARYSADCIAWNPDGKSIVSTFGTSAIIWNAATGVTLRSLDSKTSHIHKASWSSDKKRLVTFNSDNRAIIWDGATRTTTHKLQAYAFISDIAMSPDGKSLVYAYHTKASLWNLANEEELHILSGHTENVHSVSWSPDGKSIVTGSEDKKAIVWNAFTGEKLRTLSAHTGDVMSVAWSPDGKSIATGSKDDTAIIWNAATGEKLRTLTTPSWVDSVAWSPDGKSVLTTRGNTAIIWNAVTGERLSTLANHANNINIETAAWSADGKSVVTGNSDKTVDLWNAAAEKKLRTLVGHTDLVTSVTYSIDEKYLITTSGDGSTRIWETETGKELVAFYSFDDKDWLAVTPDGYFDGSVNGSKYLRYRIKGTNDLVPLERYREKFEVPGLLTKIWKGEAINKSGEVVKLDLPPLGKLLSPAVKTEVKQGKLTVKASAASRGQYPVTKFRLLVNKKPYAVKEGLVEIASPKFGTVEASWDIDLEPGSHELSVVSYNDVTFHVTDPVEVLYLGGGLANTDLPTLYVLSVGISNYKEQPLDFAHRDAQAIAEAYAAHSKPLFKKIVTKTLTNEQATREAILDELTALRKNMTQRDYGVFFFAGHGVRDARDKLYFLPHDGKRDRLSSTAIDAEAVKDEIVSTPGQLLVMLDACHAGSILAGARSLTDNLIKDLSAEDKGVAVMCSSTGNEISVEDRQHQHGRFTLALLEAIRGEGTKELPIRKVDGAVYFKQIDSYVTDRVKTLSGGEQHPVTGFPRQFRDFPLSKP